MHEFSYAVETLPPGRLPFHRWRWELWQGAWLLAANGGATTLGAALNLVQRDRRGGATEVAAAALGAPLATYTAVLICNTAVPAWSEARAEMPFVFGASAAASAAGAPISSVTASARSAARF